MKIEQLLCALVGMASLCAAALAAPVVVKVDLKPMIRAAATSKVQFAVPVPFTASVAKSGHWLAVGSRAEWHYAVQIPTAVSMSFHAARIHLPASAYLTVTSANTTVNYHAADLHKTDLWSRVQPGDALQFMLSVAADERSAVVFDIDGLQAGYRALGPQGADNPYYQQLVRTAASNNSACVQNYQCSVTPANTPLGQATVGIVVANQYQCTGTLINDVAKDNIPYLLTARHCETGKLGGGNPQQAADITVYWDAITPCNSTLGSIYDPGIIVQTGATTVVEQEDLWLVKLDESPAVLDAQFAGFDASGLAVQGGYTIHHALGYDKQLTQWFGKAYSSTQSKVLGTTYVSHFLETVNSLGNIGPGASGSGLIDGNNRLVGALSLGIKSSDTSGYESCPAPSPASPNGSNATTSFTALAAAWNSTADTTSSTGSRTLKMVLDPTNTGTKIVSSTTAASVHLSASTFSLSDGEPLQISWNAAGATGCVPSDGSPGDGWSGALGATGSITVNETFSAHIKYTLTCQLSGGRNIIQSLTVFWYGSVPYAFLDAMPIRWIGAASTLTWSSNVSPCALSGGGLAESNLPSSGTASDTEENPGNVTYTLTCGTTNPSNASSTVSYITPALTFRANGTDRLAGEELDLYWQSYADSCIPSGGAPNDGWASNALTGSDFFLFRTTPLGTWTYTLTCSSGPNSVSQSTTVTIENDTAPYVTASVTPTTVTYTATPADYFAVSWKSNLSYCVVNSNLNLEGESSTYPLLPSGASDAEDTGVFSPSQPGTYQITVACDPGVATGNTVNASSAQMMVDVLPPPAPTVQILVDPSTVTQGQQFTASWSSTNAMNCLQEGTAQSIGAVWGGDSGISTSGSQLLSTNASGAATLGLTCQSIDNAQGPVSAEVTIQVTEPLPPTVTLSTTSSQLSVGQSFTLNWNSSNATGCTAGGGGADGTVWSGPLATQGSLTVATTTTGSFTYSIDCESGSQTSTAQQVVQVVAASTDSAGGGHSGGGSLFLLDLCALASLAALRASRPVPV